MRKSLLFLILLVAFGIGVVSGVAFVRASYRDGGGAEREALAQRNRRLIAIELATYGRHEAFEREWRRQIERIDEAVQVRDMRGAVASWREAYSLAMRSGQWRDLVDVGDAALRIGDVPDFRETPHASARKSYLTALYRAEAQRSADGVLRVADAFATLGDREAAANCRAIATRLDRVSTEVSASPGTR